MIFSSICDVYCLSHFDGRLTYSEIYSFKDFQFPYSLFSVNLALNEGFKPFKCMRTNNFLQCLDEGSALIVL